MTDLSNMCKVHSHPGLGGGERGTGGVLVWACACMHVCMHVCMYVCNWFMVEVYAFYMSLHTPLARVRSLQQRRQVRRAIYQDTYCRLQRKYIRRQEACVLAAE